MLCYKDIAMFAEICEKYLCSPSSLPMVVTTVGESVYQSAINRPEGCIYHHVLTVVQGEGEVTVGGDIFLLRAGEGFFCRAGEPHAYRPTSNVFRTCWVTFVGAEGVLDYYQIGQSFRFTADPFFPNTVETLEKFCSGNSTVLSRSAAGYAWLTEWLHSCFSPSSPINAQVRQYLETHYSEPLSLNQIAEAVHMSRFSLCHHYKETCGSTVMEHLRRIRIEKAKQLLRLTTVCIEEIGQSCGFENPSYFGKVFREETGQAPNEYRKSMYGRY